MSVGETPFRTLVRPATLVNLAVVIVLSVIAILGFAPTFGDGSFLLAGLGGLFAGASAAILAMLLRFNALLSALLAIALYFVLGTPFAMPGRAIALVLPSVDSLVGLAVGAVNGWADVVTLNAPVGAPEYIAVLPYVASWLVGLLGVTLAVRWAPRAKRSPAGRAIVVLPALTLYVGGVLLGTEEAYLASIRGILFALISLVWMLWRMPDNEGLTDATRTAILRRRLIGTVAVVAGSAVFASALGTITAPTVEERFVLREVVEPPLEQFLFSSPLAGFRQYHQARNSDDVLMRVEGLADDQRIRIATMDYYDGRLWRVTSPTLFDEASGGFELVGRAVPQPDLVTPDGAVRVSVEIVGYSDVWLPSVGYAADIEFQAGAPSSTALRYNRTTGVPIVTSGVAEGMVYTVEAITQQQASLEQIATYSPARSVPTAVVQVSSATVSTRGQELASGAAGPFEKLLSIEAALLDQGSLSHGESISGTQSRAGHNISRLDELMVVLQGDHEQYAATLALMAHDLGFPVRVVMGFAPQSNGGGVVEVRGADAVAWVEVAVDDLGWVALDPTPDKEVPPPPVPQPRTEPQPLVRQPPPAPNTQDDLVSATEIEETDAQSDDGFAVPGWVWVLLAWVGIPLALYFVPILFIAALKSRRRRRRRTMGPPDRRAAGAWDELVDGYAELGYRASRRSTRIGLALNFEQQFRAELAARRREREQSLDREQKLDARKAKKRSERAARASGDASHRPFEFDATMLRSSLETVWRPGVDQKNAPLPAIPGLREFAVAADRAVFSGAAIGDAELEALWAEYDAAQKAAHSSVSAVRRQLSKFRFRARNDVVDDLAERLNDATVRRQTRKVMTP